MVEAQVHFGLDN